MKTPIVILAFLLSICLFMAISYEISTATIVYINDFSDFPAYPYNTNSYMSGGAYVGCGPTTGAMILGYFENLYGYTNLLTDPTPSGVNQGLATAWALHGASYMATHPDGNGPQLNIDPGMEDYVASRGPEIIGGDMHNYSLELTIHVGPTYNVSNPGSYNSYGAFGDAWTNDATFYKQDANGNWYIDQVAFYTQISAWLQTSIPVWVTINSTTNNGRNSDHWVPLVGVSNTGTYYFYDTWDTSIQSANIVYLYDSNSPLQNYMLNVVRTVLLRDVISSSAPATVPEPTTMLLLGSGLLGLAGLRRKFKK